MESATRVEILNKIVYVSFCAYAFGKGMDSSVLFPAIDK